MDNISILKHLSICFEWRQRSQHSTLAANNDSLNAVTTVRTNGMCSPFAVRTLLPLPSSPREFQSWIPFRLFGFRWMKCESMWPLISQFNLPKIIIISLPNYISIIHIRFLYVVRVESESVWNVFQYFERLHANVAAFQQQQRPFNRSHVREETVCFQCHSKLLLPLTNLTTAKFHAPCASWCVCRYNAS